MMTDRAPMTPEQIARTNAALRAGGLDYQVGPDGLIDAKVFVDAASKRWSKVLAKLAEAERKCDEGRRDP